MKRKIELYIKDILRAIKKIEVSLKDKVENQKVFKDTIHNNFIMLPGDQSWSPDESFFFKLNKGVQNG